MKPQNLKITNGQKNSRRGSALLVALVITGLLSLVTIGISGLIARETKIINNVLGRETAYYAAEAGIEVALLQLEEAENLIEGVDPYILKEDVRGQDSQFDPKILEKTSHVPVLTEAEMSYYEGFEPRRLFVPLAHNESVKIQLDDDLKEFIVEYYYPLAEYQEVVTKVADLDILRFKLFGQTNDGIFESLNEFYPVSRPDDPASGLVATNPGIIGTTGSHPELGNVRVWNGGKLFVSDPNQVTRCTAFDPSCDEPDQQPDVAIAEFMRTHKNKYIILTNLVDPKRVKENVGIAQESRIYYRVRDLSGSGSNGLFSPSPVIQSEGIYGGFQQQLSVTVKPDSFLPIFDFALYRPEL